MLKHQLGLAQEHQLGAEGGGAATELGEGDLAEQAYWHAAAINILASAFAGLMAGRRLLPSSAGPVAASSSATASA